MEKIIMSPFESVVIKLLFLKRKEKRGIFIEFISMHIMKSNCYTNECTNTFE